MTLSILVIVGATFGIAGIIIFLARAAGGGGKGIAIATLIMLAIAGIGIPVEMAKTAIAHSAYCHSDAFGVQYDNSCQGGK